MRTKKIENYLAYNELDCLVFIGDIKRRHDGHTYYCIDCGEKLIVRLGEHNIHHFSHRKGSTCCASAMTQLHKSAPKFIHIGDRIMLPPFETILGTNGQWTEAIITDIRLEQKEGSIRPDIIITANGKELYIELKVTHGVDAVKMARIYQNNKSTLEIDLSSLDVTNFTESAVREKILGINRDKVWLYNEAAASLNRDLIQQARKPRPMTVNVNIGYKDSVLHNVVDCPIGRKILRIKGKLGAEGSREIACTHEDCVKCKFNCKPKKGYQDLRNKEDDIAKGIDVNAKADIRDSIKKAFNILRQTSQNDDGVLCLGHLLWATLEDTSCKTLEELINKYESDLHIGIKNNIDGMCGICGYPLNRDINVVDGNNSPFLGCSRFRTDCRESLNPIEFDLRIKEYVSPVFSTTARDIAIKYTLDKKFTKLPVNLYVDALCRKNIWKPGLPRIGVPNVISDEKYQTSDFFLMEISKDNPQLVEDIKGNSCRLHENALREVRQYVMKHYDILMMYWNGEITLKMLKEKLYFGY